MANENIKVGDTLRIIYMEDPYATDYVGRTGKVNHIDSIGQIHGTWGGLALIPGVDEYELVEQ